MLMDKTLNILAKAHGDPTRHRSLHELETGLAALPPAPRDSGRVVLLVRRPAENAREVLPRAQLSPDEGLPGDKWGLKPVRNPEAQLTVMRHDLAELIANSQSLALFGDNLFVALDISTANLPPGSRLRVGGAVVEVTPLPHDGCSKFKARFGNDAVGFVNAKPTRDQNRRGIYWRIIEPGEVKIDSTIAVLSRPVSA